MDKYYWYEIGTFGGLGDYSAHLFCGTRGERQNNGYIMTPVSGGSPRWVSDTMIQNSIAGAKQAALERLQSMKEQFFRCINGLMAGLK